MSNQTEIIRNQLEKTRTRLQLLQELDLLTSEFRLIETEYRERLELLKNKLAELNSGDTPLLEIQ